MKFADIKYGLWSALIGGLLLSSCGNNDATLQDSKKEKPSRTIEDVHSLSNFNTVKVTHLDLDVAIDFDKKEIVGAATWTVDNKEQADTLILDTDELRIDSVKLDDGSMAGFHLDTPTPILGSALKIIIKPTTKKLTVYYATIYSDTDTFAALQWLEPSQTFGKQSPFLFTKSEPIASRCWIPCQDAPAVKITYTAKVKVPKGLMALMSATNPQERNAEGIYNFEMKQPIPVYLLAMAVGDVDFKAIDARTGVYAEKSKLEEAAKEFSEMPQMVEVAEKLIGPYDWERYDVIVLPSGFPIGGMENPRLTFLTPTILAGDKSLVTLIAHELAHSWAGNLVTNANWNDLWINEGFTVYFERRIMEAIRGKDYVDMLWTIGKQDLDYTINNLGEKKDLTKLKLNLKGLNPDLSFSDVAYEKGAYFLWSIEEAVGRDSFDIFLRKYFAAHRFQSISTEYFLDYMESNLLNQNSEWKTKVNYIAWVFNPGIPANCPVPGHKMFSAVDTQRVAFENDKDIKQLKTEEWSTHEWLHFLRNLSGTVSKEDMASLDNRYHLSNSKNSEIACAWYVNAIKKNYKQAFPAMEQFLKVTGRQKFLEPLYGGMMEVDDLKSLAHEIFEKSKNNYHPSARQNVSGILKGPPPVE